MSNILIIKHGSLGDIVQISGVLRDIRENHPVTDIMSLSTTARDSICIYLPEINFAGVTVYRPPNTKPNHFSETMDKINTSTIFS